MRAGGFAEDRIIQLIDRRFVPFFFNRSGHGEGGDDAATKFVNGQTKNPYAYFAAFKPTGEIVGETELYADKDAIAAWLQDLLARHPEFAAATADEQSVIAAGGLPAARLAEQLARYDDAAVRYRELQRTSDTVTRVQAALGLLRIARYGNHWAEHEVAEQALRDVIAAGADATFLVDADVERGYRLLARGEYAAARALLQPLAQRATDSKRLAEAHFSAGRACWFLGDKDWAKFHWCWIVEHLPDDRLYMRARIAAAADGMPYPNAELDGYEAPVGNIGTHSIVTAVEAAMMLYRRLLPLFEAGDFTAATPPGIVLAPGEFLLSGERDGDASTPPSALLLVAALRDGNDHVQANNRIVDQLEAIGRPAMAALVAAIEDPAFPGRGYAAWALSQVLKANDLRDEGAIAVLQKARRDGDPYVAELSRSGLSTLGIR